MLADRGLQLGERRLVLRPVPKRCQGGILLQLVHVAEAAGDGLPEQGESAVAVLLGGRRALRRGQLLVLLGEGDAAGQATGGRIGVDLRIDGGLNPLLDRFRGRGMIAQLGQALGQDPAIVAVKAAVQRVLRLRSERGAMVRLGLLQPAAGLRALALLREHPGEVDHRPSCLVANRRCPRPFGERRQDRQGAAILRLRFLRSVELFLDLRQFPVGKGQGGAILGAHPFSRRHSVTEGQRGPGLDFRVREPAHAGQEAAQAGQDAQQ